METQEKDIHTETPAGGINTVFFTASFKAMTARAFRIAKEHGWWPENQEVNHGEQLALMHSELSEALEYLRHGNKPSDHIPKFSGLEEELADVVIRIMSYAGRCGLKIPEAIIEKMAFNEGRPFKHGGKEF